MVLPDTRDATLYAAVEHGHFGTKFHASTDDGATWEERAAPAYRRDGMVDQEVSVEGPLDRPSEQRSTDRLSPSRDPLSQNRKCEKFWTVPPAEVVELGVPSVEVALEQNVERALESDRQGSVVVALVQQADAMLRHESVEAATEAYFRAMWHSTHGRGGVAGNRKLLECLGIRLSDIKHRKR